MNRRMIALLLAAVLVLALTGCAKKEHSEGKPKADLLATTQPVYQLTCALTDGTGLSVGLLISESVSCLHDYTLTVSQMEMIEQSGLVLESGLGLENFMEDVLRGKTRIDISRNLDTLPGEDGADPHWWLDPMRYKQAAELAAQELGAQYPEFADQISENLAAFCEKLSSLWRGIGVKREMKVVVALIRQANRARGAGGRVVSDGVDAACVQIRLHPVG